MPKKDDIKFDLELVPLQQLIDEARRRSAVFFCVMRPLQTKDMSWQVSWGVDGGVNAPVGQTQGSLDRVIGLVHRASNDLLNFEE